MLRLVGSIGRSVCVQPAQRRWRASAVLVDDDAEPRPSGEVEHVAGAARTRRRRSSRRRGAGWRGRGRRPASPPSPAAPGRRGRPRRSRPGRRGRWRGRSGSARRSRAGRRSHRPWRASTVTRSQAPRASGLRGLLRVADALVGGDPHPRLGARPWRGPRARGPAPPPARALARSSPGASDRRPPPSRRRWRPPGSAPRSPTASLTALTCPTSPGTPTLSLKVSKPSPAQRSRLRGHRRRLSGGQGRVAADRLGALGAELLPGRHPGRAWPAGRAAQSPRRSEREGRGRRDRRTADPSRAARATTASRLGAAPQRQRHGLSQPLDAIVVADPQQDHLAPLERAAGGDVGLAEREREGDDLDRSASLIGSGGDQQAGGEQQAEGAEQRAGAGERAVQRRAVGPLHHRPGRPRRQRRREQRQDGPPGARVGGERRPPGRRMRRPAGRGRAGGCARGRAARRACSCRRAGRSRGRGRC